MAITLLSSPQDLSPGYNPMYIYASSDNVSLDNFRYIVTITNEDTSTELATLKIKPRYGDDYLELNIGKILQGDLSTLGDDLDLNGSYLAFNNTASSGFEYSVDIGEEYIAEWDFADIQFASGIVRLVGLGTLPFSTGDQVNVVDAAEEFVFTDNNFSNGNVAFVSPGHTINIGDTVFVKQDPIYTYQAYEGYHEVVNTTATLIEIDLGFQGNTPIEGGSLWRNYQYDGLQTVTDTGVVVGGTYNGYNYIDLDQAWIDSSPTHTGSAFFWDGQLKQDPALESITSKVVFNGAVSNKAYLTWDSDDYYFTGVGQLWLTDMPDNRYVTLDDDVFLNLWTEKFPAATNEMFVNTYDAADVLLNTYSFDQTNNPYTEIQSIVMGPKGLNSLHPDIILNGTFQSTSNWTLIDATGGVASISGGELHYTDAVGDGESLAWQYGALVIGCDYEVTIKSKNNVGVNVQVGDGSNSFAILAAGENGTYTTTFTAVDEDFTITMSSTIVGQNDVILDDVIVQQLCPIIDCDVDHYTINVETQFSVEQTDFRTFYVDCSCVGRYTNYPILFMDRMGSFVPFNFDLNNKQDVDIKRDNYNKFIGDYQSGSANGYSYSLADHTNKVYNTELEEKWTLNTDWMSEEESLFFEQLMTSPLAFILIDGIYYSVNITNKTYERKRKINKKNIKYSIDILFSFNNNTQIG